MEPNAHAPQEPFGDLEENMKASAEADFSQKRHAFSAEEKTKIISKVKEFLSNRQEIRFAFLHGSFLGDLPCRDIDIAAYFDPALTAEDIFDRALTLSAELTACLPLPADVHALNLANNNFCYHSTQGLLLISRDDEETYDFVEKNWITYMDFQPLARQILSDLLE